LKNIKAHLALFSVALIYGANYTIAKEVLDPGHVKPIGFIALRVIAAFLLFSIVNLFSVKEKIEKSDWKLIFLCAVTGVFVNQISFFTGLKMTTAIHGALILTITPIIVLLAAALLLNESITKTKILGILIGMTGAAYLILAGSSINFKTEQITGDLLILVNAVFYGFYLVLVRKLMTKYHPFTILSRVFFLGLLMVLPFGWSELQEVEWNNFSTEIWAAVAYVMFFTSFVAYLLNAFALQRVTASIAGIYIYLQPIIASAISIYFAKDVMTPDKLISAALIFTGVYLVSKK